MLPILIALTAATLLAVLFLLLRKPASDAQDPRLTQVLDNLQAVLPAQLTRLDTRAEALDTNVRAQLAQLRTDIAEESRRTRTEITSTSGADFALLRTEITNSINTLGHTLNTGLDSFRTDNKSSSEALRTAIQTNLDAIAQRLTSFISEASRHQLESRDALNHRLNELSLAATEQQEKLRLAIENRLEKLNTANSAKLEEMRQTVDEKLQTTLQARLTESFGQVTDQLTKVHSGLGEMTRLSEGVNDLSRIFTNVKSRGGFAEVQLGMLLEQMLAPSQFIRNARVRLNTQEVVEFAVRFPGHSGETLLPIDAKFPREDWERLEAAYESNHPEALAAAGKAFEAAIRTEGDRISRKYINPPVTTPHAIMFLPTEGLYAEVMRRDSLQSEIQQKYQVTIAGPSTLSAILTSFQMGFHMLAIQEKGDEVWKVLAATKTEFSKFGILMSKMEDQVGTVQNTIQKLGVRTRAIDRTLREVTEAGATPENVLSFDGVAPLLAAASGTDDE
jgi:DNA recombination protein RmuC